MPKVLVLFFKFQGTFCTAMQQIPWYLLVDAFVIFFIVFFFAIFAEFSTVNKNFFFWYIVSNQVSFYHFVKHVTPFFEPSVIFVFIELYESNFIFNN